MRTAVVCLLALVLVACRTKADDPSAGTAAPTDAPGLAYEKPEGVAFHIPAIAGMSYARFQGSEMEVYLGERLEEVKLPGIRGREIKYGQGVVNVARDTIYYVRYDYPRPVSKVEALNLVGLPESVMSEMRPSAVAQWVEHSTYGYRRLVLTRSEPEVDQYVRIEAWKFLPGEKF